MEQLHISACVVEGFSQFISSFCISADSSLARPIAREVKQKTSQPPHRTLSTQKDEHHELKSHAAESKVSLEFESSVKAAPHPQIEAPGLKTDSDTKSDTPITKKRRTVGPTLPPSLLLKKKSIDKDVECKVSATV